MVGDQLVSVTLNMKVTAETYASLKEASRQDQTLELRAKELPANVLLQEAQASSGAGVSLETAWGQAMDTSYLEARAEVDRLKATVQQLLDFGAYCIYMADEQDPATAVTGIQELRDGVREMAGWVPESTIVMDGDGEIYMVVRGD